MKKKLLLALTATVCVLGCALGFAACEVGDKDYEFYLNDDGTYRITHYYSEVTDTSITVPSTYRDKSVTAIGKDVFKDCDFIVSINLPDSLKSIGESAFARCTGLTKIVLPDGLTTIGKTAFVDCSALKSIVIPTSLTSIDQGAFLDCTALTNVYYKGTAADWSHVLIGYNNDLSVCYYSSTTPSDNSSDYWHYNTDGVTPVKW